MKISVPKVSQKSGKTCEKSLKCQARLVKISLPKVSQISGQTCEDIGAKSLSNVR